ncbi:MAG: hypothetical protein BWY72_01620 [Bacteroidetes bacterium ADurb.Bin416]|nr:MAG: hypothetical protein BWY72_01620 [Bacteroidetes bacterium ADurb.Bin416]
MVGGVHFLNVEQDGIVAYDVMGQVVHIVDGHIVADVAGNNEAVGDARGQA